MPNFALERQCQGIVAGIDEAGRGPLAGPVTAAAVVVRDLALPAGLARLIDDSKKLSAARREAALEGMEACANVAIGIGWASVEEIERLNILQATFLAMGRAVKALPVLPDIVLVDGNRAPDLGCAIRTVVGGDGISLSIAAASIAAKVSRDRLMRELAARHPQYGWERNAGYGTAAHLAALARHGPTPHHRRSFLRAELSGAAAQADGGTDRRD